MQHLLSYAWLTSVQIISPVMSIILEITGLNFWDTAAQHSTVYMCLICLYSFPCLCVAEVILCLSCSGQHCHRLGHAGASLACWLSSISECILRSRLTLLLSIISELVCTWCDFYCLCIFISVCQLFIITTFIGCGVFDFHFINGC